MKHPTNIIYMALMIAIAAGIVTFGARTVSAQASAVAVSASAPPEIFITPTAKPISETIIKNKRDIREEQAKKLLNDCTWTVRYGKSWVEDTPELITVYLEPFNLTGKERDAVVGILTAETGGWGYDDNGVMVDKILVAQCLREELERGEKTIFEIGNGAFHAEPIYNGTSEQAELAYDLVFTDGKGVVACGVNYYYNPELCASDFHESKDLIAQTSQHRYFK